MKLDTPDYRYGNPDDELLPLLQCICGAKYKLWDFTISIYEDDAREMPCCGRKIYFSQRIEIHEVRPAGEQETT